jgi:hypothetical protein
MAEDSWLRNEREYFVEKLVDPEIPSKTINKILEKYNKFLQEALIGESPYAAEDLKLTILKSREKDVRE